MQRYERLLAIQTRLFGVDGGPTANAREDFAKALEGAEQWSEARLFREEVLGARRRNLGEDHRDTLIAEIWLARNLAHDAMYEEALFLAIHARDCWRRDDQVDDEDIDVAERLVTSIEKAGGLGRS